MKKKILNLASGLALLAMMSACSSTDKTASRSDSSMVDTSMNMADTSMAATGQGVQVGGATMVSSKNIVENAIASNDHTTLVAAVKAAGLVETLSGAGPFTVFAPTNEAFAKLPAGTVDNLLKPEMKADLAKVLTYHVVAGSYKAADLKNGMELTTVQGGKIKLTEKDGSWWVNDSKITVADVVSSNGVTFVIDGVLMPK